MNRKSNNPINRHHHSSLPGSWLLLPGALSPTALATPHAAVQPPASENSDDHITDHQPTLKGALLMLMKRLFCTLLTSAVIVIPTTLIQSPILGPKALAPGRRCQ